MKFVMFDLDKHFYCDYNIVYILRRILRKIKNLKGELGSAG
jgi:hypothetical protein